VQRLVNWRSFWPAGLSEAKEMLLYVSRDCIYAAYNMTVINVFMAFELDVNIHM